MDVYDRFPLQSFELLDGGTQVIKVSQSFGLGVLNSISRQSLKSKGLPLKDILCYPKRVRHPFRIICKHTLNKKWQAIY